MKLHHHVVQAEFCYTFVKLLHFDTQDLNMVEVSLMSSNVTALRVVMIPQTIGYTIVINISLRNILALMMTYISI